MIPRLLAFVKDYFKLSFLSSDFLVGVKPGAVNLGVLLSCLSLACAGAGLRVPAPELRLFQSAALDQHGAPVVVLVKSDDAIGAHIVSLF